MVWKNNRYRKEEPWSKELRRALSPHSGEDERSWFTQSSDSDSVDQRRSDRKIKSGINAKPCSKVRKELTYPHFSLGQTSSFMGTSIQFHSLTYEQFMAGELNTIMNIVSSEEHRGRVALLQKISNWKLLANVSWPQIRNTYAHVLRKIENRELGWNTDFNHFKRHIYEKLAMSKLDKIDKNKFRSSTDWFCKQYQKLEGCSRESPHPVKFGNQTKQAYHFCATCWNKDKVKKLHSESALECPYKEQ